MERGSDGLEEGKNEMMKEFGESESERRRWRSAALCANRGKRRKKAEQFTTQITERHNEEQKTKNKRSTSRGTQGATRIGQGGAVAEL